MKKQLVLLAFSLSVLLSQGQDIIHYWHFNTANDDSLVSVAADYTVQQTNPQITYQSAYANLSAPSRMDDVGGTDINARLAEPDGRGIRPRNPSDSMELIIQLPSNGYENLSLSYASERSGSGMLKQVIYTTVDGITYQQFGDTVEVATDYELITFDFSGLPSADDNSDFGIKIMFFEQNTASNGNNRFDNVVLEGSPLSASGVSDVFISPENVSVYVNDEVQFSASVVPASAADTGVSWSSSDLSVATVNASGMATAEGTGTAYVIVSTNDGGHTDTAEFIVEEPPASDDLIYYWHFNNLEAPDDISTIDADFSLIDGADAKMVYQGSGNRDIDDYSPGSDINLHNGEDAGIAARVRNRSEDRSLLFNLSTVGCDNIRFEYAIHRSGSGMLKNIIEYSTDGGSTFTNSGLPISEFDITENYSLVTVNFEDIASVNDNPDFQIRITWEGNTDQTNGNNRYDNITLKGDAYDHEVSSPVHKNEIRDVSIFPNPSNGIFTIQSNNNTIIYDRITVMDINGRTVHTSIKTNHKQIDLSMQPKGMYLIRIELDQKTTIKKILIK